MAEPQLVADCVKAMVDVANRPITVKHRLGLNEMDAQGQVADYQWVLDFMCQVAQAGATQLTIHARNAVLKGLSPKENREVPPLRYDIAKRLRQDVQRHFRTSAFCSMVVQLAITISCVIGMTLMVLWWDVLPITRLLCCWTGIV